MKKVLLVGNPNVGKSTIFSHITGIGVVISNYPGTTVEFFQGTTRIKNKDTTLIDVPGVYSLDALSEAERIAINMIDDCDVVVNVVDATNLERNLYLTLHLLEKGIPVIVALNFWDEAKRKGIDINLEKLEKLLGVPVVTTIGITGEGFKDLILRIPEAFKPKRRKKTDAGKWLEIGRIVSKTQILTQHHTQTLLEKFSNASIKPLTGIPIAIIIIFIAFKTVRFIGETLISFIVTPLFDTLWLPTIMKLSSLLRPETFFHSMLIGNLTEGRVNFEQSFGILTAGLFIPLGIVLPYIIAFYLVINFLEDFGYLPRLAVLLDNTMHKIGLHGWAIIPALLGLGCNVPGIMATRVLEDKRQRLIASTIICIGIPCASLQAMIWGILGKHGGKYVGIVYGTLFISCIVIGKILNFILKGRSPELIMEVPPYRIPSFKLLGKKLWMRTKSFLKEALPIVALSILIVNVLYLFHIFDDIANFTAPLVTKVWGLPKDSITALTVGFFRKDVSIGLLNALYLTPKQLTIAATVLSMFFPCVAVFATLTRELGIIAMFKSLAIMLASSIIVGGVLNLIMT